MRWLASGSACEFAELSRPDGTQRRRVRSDRDRRGAAVRRGWRGRSDQRRVTRVDIGGRIARFFCCGISWRTLTRRTKRCFYRVLGPIDQPAWRSLGVDSNEPPAPVFSSGCSLKAAVFLSPVIRSIASEHKPRVPARAAAIIRRSIEGVTAVAPGYSLVAVKAGLFSRSRCPRWIQADDVCAPSTRPSSL